MRANTSFLFVESLHHQRSCIFHCGHICISRCHVSSPLPPNKIAPFQVSRVSLTITSSHRIQYFAPEISRFTPRLYYVSSFWI